MSPTNDSSAVQTDILVIEDSVADVNLLKMFLEPKGVSLSVAEDGQAGVDFLETHPLPTMIVLDMSLPRLDGWAVLKRIRSSIKLKNIPVIMYSSAINTTRAVAAGADYFFQKGGSLEEFEKMTEQFFLIFKSVKAGKNLG